MIGTGPSLVSSWRVPSRAARVLNTVLSLFRIGRERAVRTFAGQSPSEALIRSAPAVASEDTQPGAGDTPAAHDAGESVVRLLGDASTPVLDGDPEVEDLVLPNRREADHRVGNNDDAAVDPGSRELLAPSPRNVVAWERQLLLREDRKAERAASGTFLNSRRQRRTPVGPEGWPRRFEPRDDLAPGPSHRWTQWCPT